MPYVNPSRLTPLSTPAADTPRQSVQNQKLPAAPEKAEKPVKMGHENVSMLDREVSPDAIQAALAQRAKPVPRLSTSPDTIQAALSQRAKPVQ
jgi:hypothetical protein